jgi:methylenetetrahydrofolate dehydrogenase (NADP+)/methenyltetrahydrofolate cyclohydrolase
VGDNEASNRYVRNKVKDCEEVGISAEVAKFHEEADTCQLVHYIMENRRYYDGIIVQLPLPEHINKRDVIAAIDKAKDVDGFKKGSKFNPCTPQGIMMWLDKIEFELSGAHVVVIGRSDIVGKPMAKMLIDADATVTLCHSKTKDLDKIVKMADLVICAVGKANFLDCKDITVPVIDVGINFVDGKLVGDCYNGGDNVSPVPGGVGLLTRMALLYNVILAHLNSKGEVFSENN